MRRLLLAIPAALLLVSPHAGAQSQDYPLIEHNDVSTVHVTAGRSHAAVQRNDDLKGTYELANGWSLHVRPVARGLIAQIDSQAPMRLIALTENHYTTADGNVQMQFDPASYGQDMTMSYVPSSRIVAWITVSSTTLASR